MNLTIQTHLFLKLHDCQSTRAQTCQVNLRKHNAVCQAALSVMLLIIVTGALLVYVRYANRVTRNVH